MSNQLTNPLQSLLSQAAKRIPATTGATASYHARYDSAGTVQVILCDVSGSMDAPAWGGQKKIALLREAVTACAQPHHQVVAFDSQVMDVTAGTIPPPGSSTAMHLAIAHIASRRPKHTLIISDGQPDNAEAALAEAGKLSGIIDVLYIGPDSDASAIAFMRQLARLGCGSCTVHDVSRPNQAALPQVMRKMLPG